MPWVTEHTYNGAGSGQAFFLGGLDKAPVLERFKPHIFFDDQLSYCEPASKIIPTGHVPSGVKNDCKYDIKDTLD